MWKMFANKKPDGTFYNIYKGEFQVKLCGSQEIVPVIVSERQENNPPSPYWGWLATNKTEPTMIWPSYLCLCVCFQAESAMLELTRLGRGKPINLNIVGDVS